MNSIGQFTTHELNYLLANKKWFRGTHPIDHIPVLKNKQGTILNYHNSDLPGSHWVALWKDKNKYYYFDSYGVLPPSQVLDIIRNKGFTNIHRFQQYGTDLCGLYAVYVLNELSNGKSFADIVYSFELKNRDANRDNDELVLSYAEKHFEMPHTKTIPQRLRQSVDHIKS